MDRFPIFLLLQVTAMNITDKNQHRLGMVAHTLISALRGQRKVNLCELKSNLVYSESSRTAKATQRNSVLKNNNKKSKSYITACHTEVWEHKWAVQQLSNLQ